MNTPTHSEISQRAEQIWRDLGSPAGRDDEIWFQAERELMQSDGHPAAPEPAVAVSADKIREETAAESVAEFHLSPPPPQDKAIQAALQDPNAPPKLLPRPPGPAAADPKKARAPKRRAL